MVNTLAVCLMIVCQDDQRKIKKFLVFWLEKIEFDMQEEDEYDYPKYLLRNTLCNIYTESQEFEECLKICNLNIKETSMDIKQSKAKREAESSVREKVRILIISILYKVDCLLFLQSGNDTLETCRDMIRKCEGMIEKFNLRNDTKLTETIKRKARTLNTIKSQEELNSLEELPFESRNSQPQKSEKKTFIVKTKRGESSNMGRPSSRVRRQSPDFSEVRQSDDMSPKFSTFTGFTKKQASTPGRSPKNVFFATKSKGKEGANNTFSNAIGGRLVEEDPTRRSVKGILRKGTGGTAMETYNKNPKKEYIRVKTSQYKKEFNKELGELFKLTDLFRKEIFEIRQSMPEPAEFQKKPKKTILKKSESGKNSVDLFDDSNSLMEDKKDEGIDTQIKKAFEHILNSQAEIDQKRKVLVEKLEKIEKNLERQTTEDTNSAFPQITLKGIGESQGAESNRSDAQKPNILYNAAKNNTCQTKLLNEKTSNTSLQPCKTPQQATSHFLKVGTKPVGAKSANSSVASDVSVHSKFYETTLLGYSSALKHCLHSFSKNFSAENQAPKNTFFREFKQRIESSGAIFDILYSLKQADPQEEPTVVIKVFDEKACYKGKPLVEETIDVEMLRFIFKKISAVEVLPSHLPVTSFTHIGCFLHYVLTKFMIIDQSDPSFHRIYIGNAPRNLLEETIPIIFFEEEHNLSLVHLNDFNFRLLIRKAEVEDKERENECLMIDLFFNEFVMNNFFQVSSSPDCSGLIEKLIKKEKLTKEQADQLRTENSFFKQSVWVVANKDNRVYTCDPEKTEADHARAGQELREPLEAHESHTCEALGNQPLLRDEAGGLATRPIHSVRSAGGRETRANL